MSKEAKESPILQQISAHVQSASQPHTNHVYELYEKLNNGVASLREVCDGLSYGLSAAMFATRYDNNFSI